MKKFLFLSVILFFLISSVQAELLVLQPVQVKVNESDIVELGAVSAGETIKLIIDRRGWDELQLLNSESFSKSKLKVENETLTLEVTLPENISLGFYGMKVKAVDLENNETLNFKTNFEVRKDLITIDLVRQPATALLLQPVTFEFLVLNDSISSHQLTLYSSLPLTWFSEEKVLIEPKSSKTFTLIVIPQLAGLKEFSFNAGSSLNNTVLRNFDLTLSVEQTISSNFTASLNGLSFFTPNLIVVYVVQGFIGLLF
ncbi:MAG: hypothetical protein ABH821_04390 [archaeon]